MLKINARLRIRTYVNGLAKDSIMTNLQDFVPFSNLDIRSKTKYLDLDACFGQYRVVVKTHSETLTRRIYISELKMYNLSLSCESNHIRLLIYISSSHKSEPVTIPKQHE